jgi:hypothetical protein
MFYKSRTSRPSLKLTCFLLGKPWFQISFWRPAILIHIIRGFPQDLQENFGITGLGQDCFIPYYLKCIYRRLFGAVQTELLTPSLNEPQILSRG